MTVSAIPCSVIVLTLDEERNLAACLESIAGFDDIHVLDSGSTDATPEIARRLGANLASNPFRGFGNQRNWGHDHLPLAHDWVLHLDADERMTTPLAEEIHSVLGADDGHLAGYFVAERTLLRGQWLRHAGQYPRYQVRLVHRRRMRYVDHGHGQRESSDLPFGTLRHSYDHHAFSHGIEHWLRKHVGYAIKEAEVLVDSPPLRRLVVDFLSGGPVQRRRVSKALAAHVPMRPLLRYLHVLILHGGVLDGKGGREYARMLRVYEEMTDLAMLEARDRRVRGVANRGNTKENNFPEPSR